VREAVDTVDAPGAEQGWLAWLAEHGVPGIAGVDTRALVRHIRSAGAMRGGIFPAAVSPGDAMDLVRAEPSMVGRDLAREVTVEAPVVHGDGGHLRIVALDTGIKRSIVRNFVQRGVQLELYPCTTGAEELLARDPDGFFLVPGPGDPAALDYVVDTIRSLLVRKPVFGICLGHQLLSRAAGLETFKLPFGHRGANHPVLEIGTNRVLVTSQNHGFAVEGDGPQVTHVSLYDGTVEGLSLPGESARSLQFHPEAGPGPHDAWPLLEGWVEELRLAEAA
jgi:carbamoyl-phosphate synthase small subunit